MAYPFCRTAIGISLAETATFTNFMTAVGQRWDLNDSGIDLGTAWAQPEYVEGADWRSGNGVFYFNHAGNFPGCAGPPGLALPPGLATYYFRTAVVVPPDTPRTGLLRLTHLLNDGAVFYLNGTEILRLNMPTGPIGYGTPPSGGGSTLCATNLVPIGNLLVPGTNRMAVELHEAFGLLESSAYFGMSLDFATNHSLFTTNTSPLPPELRIAATSPTTSLISWSADDFTWGLEFTTNLRPDAVWKPLPDSSPYTNVLSPGGKFFRARVR